VKKGLLEFFKSFSNELLVFKGRNLEVFFINLNSKDSIYPEMINNKKRLVSGFLINKKSDIIT